MSYDLYVYKSKSGKLEIDDALKVIEGDNEFWTRNLNNYETKTAIEKSLIYADPTLEGFDYEELSRKQRKTVDEIKGTFKKFELNGTDPDIQILVYDYHVAISIPYVHRGEQASKAFEKLRLYIDTINKVAGYFLYDPQTGEVYDPAQQKFEGLTKYLAISNDFGPLFNSIKGAEQRKPWWKVW